MMMTDDNDTCNPSSRRASRQASTQAKGRVFIHSAWTSDTSTTWCVRVCCTHCSALLHTVPPCLAVILPFLSFAHPLLDLLSAHHLFSTPPSLTRLKSRASHLPLCFWLQRCASSSSPPPPVLQADDEDDDGGLNNSIVSLSGCHHRVPRQQEVLPSLSLCLGMCMADGVGGVAWDFHSTALHLNLNVLCDATCTPQCALLLPPLIPSARPCSCQPPPLVNHTPHTHTLSLLYPCHDVCLLQSRPLTLSSPLSDGGRCNARAWRQ